jgi:hypothetical protein
MRERGHRFLWSVAIRALPRRLGAHPATEGVCWFNRNASSFEPQPNEKPLDGDSGSQVVRYVGVTQLLTFADNKGAAGRPDHSGSSVT